MKKIIPITGLIHPGVKSVLNTGLPRKISISLALAIGIFTGATAQKTVKVLFIGNSYTYVEDLPTMFKNLASGAGKTVVVDEEANPGQYFDESGAQPGHATSSATYDKIYAQAWDYVVLQDNQGYFCTNVHSIPSYALNSNKQVRDSVRAIQPCAKVVWFAGWGLMGGLPSQFPGDNTIAMNNRIDSNYQWMNNMNAPSQDLIAPFGKAWNYIIKSKPSMEASLFNTDGSHPGRAGQLSNAAVLYTMIFKQDPSISSYTPSGISTSTALFLKTTAYQTVMYPYIYNSHQMPKITPVVTNNSGVLSVSGTYSAYQWYLNNVAIAGATSPAYTPTANGSYRVIATTNGTSCAQNWSFPVDITTTAVRESIPDKNITIYPNPVADQAVIELKDVDWEGSNISIINMMGETVRSERITSDTYFIRKHDFKPGLYIFTITDKSGNKFLGKIDFL